MPHDESLRVADGQWTGEWVDPNRHHKGRLYRFTPKSGRTDYFNKEGQSVRKALLRTPVDGVRVSSGWITSQAVHE